MSVNEHTSLWDAVSRTPKEYTKAITGKPYKGTSPAPYYLVRKATETFGPCGIGWGFTIPEQNLFTGREGTIIHVAKVRVWYLMDGKRGEVEHLGQTVFSGKNRNGEFTDEDAFKKSVTDGLTKALSMLGFAGDIFMGRYDDSKYVAELEQEQRAAQKPREVPAIATAPVPEAPPQETSDQLAYAAIFRLALDKAGTAAELRRMWEAERKNRERIDLHDYHPLAHDLHAEWKAKGLALAAAEKAKTEKDAA